MRHRLRKGTIYRRKDGFWEGQLRFTTAKKKRISKSVFAPTRRQATAKFDRLQRELSLATPKAMTINVADFLSNWLTTIKPNVKKYTYRDAERVIRLHINPYIGGLRLSALTPMRIDTFYGQLIRKRIGHSVRAQVHAHLRWAMGQAVRWGYFHRNPVKFATTPKRRRKPVMNVLAAVEARRFLKCARKDRLWALYAVSIATGARLGEIFALTWSQINLDTGEVSFDRNQVEISGEISYDLPKTKASMRKISLASFAHKALREHRDMSERAGILNERVFAAPKGGPLRASNFRKNEFYPLLNQAGVKRIKFHEIRHTTASILLGEKNVHPIAVSKLLGHAKPSTTLNTYTQILDPGSPDAAKKMDLFLRNQGLAPRLAA